MTPVKRNQEIIKEFYTLWRKLLAEGLDLFFAETYNRIDIGDVVIDEKGSE